jgi:hypothetical protein
MGEIKFDKETCMVTKSKFKLIQEDLDRVRHAFCIMSDKNISELSTEMSGIRHALEQLLELLDKAVCES